MRRMVVLQLLVTVLTCMLGVPNIVLSASEAALNISKPGCEQRCGNVHIPFPFGIGPNCSLDKWFEISCNKSTTPHRPFLQPTQWEVLHISDFYSTTRQIVRALVNSEIYTVSHQFQVKNPVSFFNCRGKKAAKALNLVGMPFHLSPDSTFVAVSCGDLAKVNSSSGNTTSQTRCPSICSPNDSTTATNKTYCETSIPAAGTFEAFEITFENSSTTSVADQDPYGRDCNFAFLVDNEYWNNNNTNIARIRSMDYVPLNITWYVNYTEFYVFKTNTSFGRGCYHLESGLECECSGLLGNPYLIDGCSQDINECRDDNPHYCGPGGTCVNTHGSVHCSYKRKFILIGVGSGLGALLLLFCPWGIYKFVKKRKDIKRKRKFFKRNGGLLLQQQLSSSENNVEKTKMFNSNELEKAERKSRVFGEKWKRTTFLDFIDIYTQVV